MNKRLTVLKSILWMMVGVLTVVTVARFTHGLGATTNLSDAAPWGLWIAFDVMAGVALAAGGFVLAATVYIFRLEKYRPFVRPAILTAFLGYIAVAVGLMYDLGLPWNAWHPLIYWQYHSVLFEVGACVICYLTVLSLEFAPVVLEHPLLDRALFRNVLAVLKKATLPLVIAGIVLSTLHQSSLGSLFLIVPHRLHPLWYSPILYVLFFVSAVGLGLMMVTLESLFSAYFFGHKVQTKLLAGLGRAAAIVLALYTILRIGDLALRGVLGTAVDGSWQSAVFVFEMAVCAVIPAVLLAVPRVRGSVGGLAVCSIMTVAGMIMTRINICIVAVARPAEAPYFPRWTELAVSLGIVSLAVLVFMFFVERLRVYEHPTREVEPAPPRPSFDPATLHGLAPLALAAPRRYSLLFLVGAALAVAALPEQAVLGIRARQTPVLAVRMIEGWTLQRTGGPGRLLQFDGDLAVDSTGEDRTPLMMIDGNRDGRLALFDHQGHEDRLGEEESCAKCHHMNMPLDRATSCHECHRDMYEPTLIFDHASHVRATDGNAGCVECHEDPSAVKTYETATACMECHAASVMAGSTVKMPSERWNAAVGYMEAMHKLCIPCHETRAAEDPGVFPAIQTECRGCHDADNAERLRLMTPRRRERGAKIVRR